MILFLDKDEQVVRIQRSVQIKSLEHEQTFGDRYVSNVLHGEIGLMDEAKLNRIEYIAISSPDQPYKFQYFWLKDSTIDKNLLSFTGVDTGIEELSKTPIYDRRFKSYTADTVIEELLAGTNWTTRQIASTDQKSVQFYYMSVFDALKKVCETYQLEMQFFVETTATGIGNRYIEFKKKLGGNYGSRVVYGKNGIEIIKESNRAELYTALIGRGKGEEVSTAEENDSGQAGYGRKINFEELVWSKANGDPVDKPEGQKYVELPEATEQYGYKGNDGKMYPKIGFIDFDEEEDRDALLQRTYDALLTLARPQVAFKTSATFLKGNICDTVRVVRPDRNIDYETRIYHIIWDRRIEDKPRAVTIEFGDSGTNKSLSQHLSSNTNSEIGGKLENFNNHLNQVINEERKLIVKSADGKNSNYYMESDPRDLDIKPRIGDSWFRPDPDIEGETILYVWNGEVWEEILRTADKDLIAKEFEEIQKQWDTYDKQFNEWNEQTESKLEAFNQSVEDKLNGTYESTIAYLDQYDDEITQQVRDEMEQTRKELELSIGKLVTPDEMNGQIDHMIEQAKAEMISSDELHASINEAIANAKSDLLTPLQVRDMIEQALAEQGIDEAEIKRLLKEYDGFVRVEDYQQWTEEKQKEIDDAWRQATQGKELSQTTMELLGKPEHIDYGKNLVDGATTQSNRNGRFTIKSKYPLDKDKKYTLSFKLECLLPQKGSLVLNFKDSDSHVTDVDSELPTAEATIVVKHEQAQVTTGNLTLNFNDSEAKVTHTDTQLPTADATIVVKHE